MSDVPDLIASYFTLAGNLLPHEPPLVSPVSLTERIDAAASAGFAGMGFNFDDAAIIREQFGDARLRTMLADAGLRWIELEVLVDWFADGVRRERSNWQRRMAFDQARALGAFQLKVVGDLAGDSPLDRMAEAFAQLCDEAAAHGIRITLELLPISNLTSLEHGLAVVGAAARPNGGLMFDAWHVARGHIPLSAIAALPPGLCTGVELDDGATQPVVEDLYEEMIHYRRWPGEGEYDLAGLIRATRAAGFYGPYGVEIMSYDNRALSAHEAAQRAADGARRLFAQVDSEVPA